MPTREAIEKALTAMNAAENSTPSAGADAAIAGIDAVMSPSVVGWTNGEYRPDREAERSMERFLFSQFPDYNRIIERVAIDPPFAAIGWKMTGTDKDQDRGMEVLGSSHFEFTDEGKIAKYWVYLDTSQLSG